MINIVYKIIEEEQLKMFKCWNTQYYKIILANNICNRHIKLFKERHEKIQ